MTDEANAPSNGAGEVTSVEQSVPQTVDAALERAFDKLEIRDDDDNFSPERGQNKKEEGETPGEQPRSPDGKWAKKDQPPTNPEAKPEGSGAKVPEQPAVAAPLSASLQRLPREIQGDVANLPEHVRAGIEKAITGLTRAADQWSGLKKYSDQAQTQGTTIDKLFEGYVSWENAFKRNPVEAFVNLLNNVGINPASVLQESVLSGQTVQPQQAPAPNMDPVFNELNALKQQLAEIQQRPVVEQVQAFAKEAPFFDLLQNDIAESLRGQSEAGETPDLQKAYDAALAKYPDLAAVAAAKKSQPQAAPAQPGPEAAKEAEEKSAAQTRKAALSITGVPSGSIPAQRKASSSVDDALEKAFAQVGI